MVHGHDQVRPGQVNGHWATLAPRAVIRHIAHKNLLIKSMRAEPVTWHFRSLHWPAMHVYMTFCKYTLSQVTAAYTCTPPPPPHTHTHQPHYSGSQHICCRAHWMEDSTNMVVPSCQDVGASLGSHTTGFHSIASPHPAEHHSTRSAARQRKMFMEIEKFK